MRSFTEFVSEQAAQHWVQDVGNHDVYGICIASGVPFSDPHCARLRRDIPVQLSTYDGQS
jgi:hypothetical protein